MSAELTAIDIVVVDFRAGPLLDACLESIVRHRPTRVRLGKVVVVDNAAGPNGSLVRARNDLPFQLIANGANRGFAAACNQGAAAGSAPYILFLNPDTKLFDGSVDTAVEFLEHKEEQATGVVGIALVDEEGRPQATCFRFPAAHHFLNKALGLNRIAPSLFPIGGYADFQWDRTQAVDQVMGAFFLARRSVFAKLNGFDERFFVYFEEMDFSLRALQAGFRSVYLPTARAYHAGGGTTDRIRATRLFYTCRSRLLYGIKHFHWAPLLVLFLVTLVAEPFARVVAALATARVSDAAATVQAFGMLVTWLVGGREGP